MTSDRRVEGKTRLIEAQAAALRPRFEPHRQEIARPGGEALRHLVVVDEGRGLQEVFRGQARSQQRGGAYRQDLLVHEEVATPSRRLAPRGDGDIVRPFGEVAFADRGLQAQIDARLQGQKAIELRHQPEAGDRGRGGDDELAALASAAQRHENRLQLVEPLRKLGERVDGGGNQGEPAVPALEQRRFEKAFERLDLMTDRRGRHAEFVGGAAYAEMSRRRFEGAQGVERDISAHGGLPSRFPPPTPLPLCFRDRTRPAGALEQTSLQIRTGRRVPVRIRGYAAILPSRDFING